MKFIKKTLLSSSSSPATISALVSDPQRSNDVSNKTLLKQLQLEYQQLKSKAQHKIKNHPKYDAYLDSLQSLLENKDKPVNKKIDALISSFHLNGKKKFNQIPLIEAFSKFSSIEKYKFLIDILKHTEDKLTSQTNLKSQSYLNTPTKKKCLQAQNQKPSSVHSTPTKKKQLQQSRIKLFAQAQISLNQLKTMSLSYWTKVNFELNCQKQQIKVTGKQSFIIYLQNYLVRLSKNQKYCFVLLSCNHDQVPSWLRKVYVTLKKQIFAEIFQSIWNEIVRIQVQKIALGFDQHQKDIQLSPTKSFGQTSVDQDQFQIDKEQYLVFLTPLIIKSYYTQKAKFKSKIKNKLKFMIYKQIQFDQVQTSGIKQKLEKISFSKASDEKNKQIYQVKGYFNIPASIVKFKFIDSLKQRNKYISSWQILQKESTTSMQAISQTFDFKSLFQSQVNPSHNNIFKFKQFCIKQQISQYSNNQINEVLVLQSIKQISKSSIIEFMMIECFQSKHQKSQFILSCEFNKHLLKRKVPKRTQGFNKYQIAEMTKKIIENFLKQMILMIFTQTKIYEEKQVDDQEFFTICEAFSQDVDQVPFYSSKSINVNEEKVVDSQKDQDEIQSVSEDNQSDISQHQHQNKVKKVNSLNIQSQSIQEEQPERIINLKKSKSLNEQIQICSDIKAICKIKQTDLHTYLKTKFSLIPQQKSKQPNLLKSNLLSQEWMRLKQGGLTCINQKKIKQQKQILKKILVKLGQNILKQKNIMNISLPVTIFKTQSQLTTVARGLSYAPLFLEPQCYSTNSQIDHLERVKKSIVFLISDNYSQINFQKPFNPILGQTLQLWVDGCPVYFEQISHHPPITYYYFLGRGFKIYGALEPSLSMGINHAKVFSWCVENIQFEDGTKIKCGPNKMLVNGTTFGLRTFNLDDKNFIYDTKNNILSVFSYGPSKKGLFSNSQQPFDHITGKIWKMTDNFKNYQFQKWYKRLDYVVKKQWIEKQVSEFNGCWNQKIVFDGVEYFDFQKQNPYELVQEQNPLPSDSRYRQDLQWLIKGDLQKSQQSKQKMEQDQRHDKKLRSKHAKH